MKSKILGTIGFVGFLLLTGSVGGIEQDTLSITQGILQSIIGLSMMFLFGCFARLN